MPHLSDKLHFGGRKRVVFWEFQLSGEDAAFERCAFGSLDQCFPDEHVVFTDGTGGYAFWWVGGERAVFFKEAFRG